jgi:hypothetical protein
VYLARLDEEDQGVEQDAVAGPGGGTLLGLQPGHERVEVGDVGADAYLRWVGRVGEGADVRDAQWPELLLAKVRIEPVVAVRDVVESGC